MGKIINKLKILYFMSRDFFLRKKMNFFIFSVFFGTIVPSIFAIEARSQTLFDYDSTSDKYNYHEMNNIQHYNFTNVMFGGVNIKDDPLDDSNRFLVLIESQREKDDAPLRCLGVAVDHDIVITAGHCLHDVYNTRVSFIKSLDPIRFETIHILASRVHPAFNAYNNGRFFSEFNEYNSSSYHDIGVVLLSEPSKYAQPIILSPSNFDVIKPDDNQEFYLFGRSRDAHLKYDKKISFLNVYPRRPLYGGNNMYFSEIKDNENNTHAICQGDSGSPVTVSAEDVDVGGKDIHYLVGILSLFNGFIKPGAKGMVNDPSMTGGRLCGTVFGFVNIHSEIDWIKSAINEMDPDGSHIIRVYGE